MNKSPCAKDCPDRNESCHGRCEKYLKFYEENKKRREEKLKDRITSYASYASENNLNRKKKKKRK